MLDAMFELPNREDIGEVVIDASVVAGKRRPRFKRRGPEDKQAAVDGENQDAA
jgi:ATP-dependent Clp protease ATP-binding subunit ClpX